MLRRSQTVMASGGQIQLLDLPSELRGVECSKTENDWLGVLSQTLETRLGAGGEPQLKDVLPAVERLVMDAALKHTGGKKRQAAKLLGWGRNTLTRKLQKTATTPPATSRRP